MTMISIKPFSCSGVTQSPSCHEGLARICQAHGENEDRFLEENELQKYNKQVVEGHELFHRTGDYTYDFKELSGGDENDAWGKIKEILCAGSAILSLCDLCHINVERFEIPPDIELARKLMPADFEQRRISYLHWIGNRISKVELKENWLVITISKPKDYLERVLLATNGGPGRDLLRWGNHPSLKHFLKNYVGLEYKGTRVQAGMENNDIWDDIIGCLYEVFVLHHGTEPITPDSPITHDKFMELFFDPNLIRILCEDIDNLQPEKEGEYYLRFTLDLVRHGLRAKDILSDDLSKVASRMERSACAVLEVADKNGNELRILQLLIALDIGTELLLKRFRTATLNEFSPPRLFFSNSIDRTVEDLSRTIGEERYTGAVVIIKVGDALNFRKCEELLSKVRNSRWDKKPLILFFGDQDIIKRLKEVGIDFFSISGNKKSQKKIIQACQRTAMLYGLEKDKYENISYERKETLSSFLAKVYNTLTGVDSLMNYFMSYGYDENEQRKINATLILFSLIEFLPNNGGVRVFENIERDYKLISSNLPRNLVSDDINDTETILKLFYLPSVTQIDELYKNDSLIQNLLIALLEDNNWHPSWLIYFTLLHIKLQYGEYKINSNVFSQSLPPSTTERMVEIILDEGIDNIKRVEHASSVVSAIRRNPSPGRNNLLMLANQISAHGDDTLSDFTKLLIFQVGFAMAYTVISDNDPVLLKELLSACNGSNSLHLGILETIAREGFGESREEIFESLINSFSSLIKETPNGVLSLMLYDVLWYYVNDRKMHYLDNYFKKISRISKYSRFRNGICRWIHKGDNSLPRPTNEEMKNIAFSWSKMRDDFHIILDKYLDIDELRKTIEPTKIERCKELVNVKI